MNIHEMKRKDFDALPRRKWDEDIGEFEELIILPLRSLHDSGYRLLDFIAVKGGEPIARLSGCSDVIHINGIGGYSKFKGEIPRLIEPIGWSIDCLPKSGLLRLFTGESLTAGEALSRFEIYG